MRRSYFDAHGLRCYPLEIVFEEARDFFVVLVRHQAARNLGVRFRRKHRLRAFARISAPDSADVERRTATVALQRRISRLATQFADADCRLVRRFIERNLRDHCPFLAREFFHVVVKMRDANPTVFADDGSQHFAQHVDRIRHRTRRSARNEGLCSAPVTSISQYASPRRPVVRDGTSALTMLVSETRITSARSSSLCVLQNSSRLGEPISLLALEDKFHVRTEIPRPESRLEALHLHHALPLIVVGAARIDFSVAERGFEGVAKPQIQRLDRHHTRSGHISAPLANSSPARYSPYTTGLPAVCITSARCAPQRGAIPPSGRHIPASAACFLPSR